MLFNDDFSGKALYLSETVRRPKCVNVFQYVRRTDLNGWTVS